MSKILEQIRGIAEDVNRLITAADDCETDAEKIGDIQRLADMKAVAILLWTVQDVLSRNIEDLASIGKITESQASFELTTEHEAVQ
jgi:hypothetical protein